MKKSPYFVNLWVDSACLGLLSLATLAGIGFFTRGEASSLALRVSLVLQWFVNWPHFSATSYRLFRTPQNRAQFPLTAYLIPVVVGLGVVASFLSPEAVAPFFIKLFLIWSPYHFSGQTIGLTLVYARRDGITTSPWFRRALTGFVLGTYLFSIARGESGAIGGSYYGIGYPSLNIPPWIATVCAWGMGLSAVMLAAVWIAQSRALKRPLPAILALPALTQFGWFIVGPYVPAFYVFVPLFHSLQYLLIAWAVQMKESAPDSSVPRETFLWAGINFIGGVILFFGLPQLASRFGLELSLATGILISGVQIHHFFVDGVIWKLRTTTKSREAPSAPTWAAAA